MLLVVSIVIAAVGTTDAGATIAGESRRLVCEIGGGGDCGSPPAPQPAPTPCRRRGPRRRRPRGDARARADTVAGSRGPAADRRPGPGAPLPRLGHRQVHLRCPATADLHARRQARRHGQGDRRTDGRALGDRPRRDRLPIADALDRNLARAGTERPGRQHDRQRLARRLPRPGRQLRAHGVTTGRRRHRSREPPRAEPGRPEHDRPRREHPTHARVLYGHRRRVQLPRAPARDGLRRGHTRLQRRHPHQPDQRAGHGRRRRLRAPNPRPRARL